MARALAQVAGQPAHARREITLLIPNRNNDIYLQNCHAMEDRRSRYVTAEATLCVRYEQRGAGRRPVRLRKIFIPNGAGARPPARASTTRWGALPPSRAAGVHAGDAAVQPFVGDQPPRGLDLGKFRHSLRFTRLADLGSKSLALCCTRPRIGRPRTGRDALFSQARTGMYTAVLLCHGDCLSWSELLVRNVEVDGDV